MQALCSSEPPTGEARAPRLVALDGRSGAGKSTLTARLAQQLGGPDQAVVVPGDDFYDATRPDAFWDATSPAERADLAIDWRRLRREALEPLLAGRSAVWRTYDYPAQRPDGTFPLSSEPVRRAPAPVVLLDGAYSARPELRDLVDLAVLVHVTAEVQRKRLAQRDGTDGSADWLTRWAPAEEQYFTRVCPAAAFDLVLPCEA